MNKAEIISQTLKVIKLTVPPSGDEQDEEAFIVSVLQDKLPDGDIMSRRSRAVTMMKNSFIVSVLQDVTFVS